MRKLAMMILAATFGTHSFLSNAKTVTITGQIDTWDTPSATTTYPKGKPTFTGWLDTESGSYEMRFSKIEAHVNVKPIFKANVTTTGLIYSGQGDSAITVGEGVQTTCNGSFIICNSLPKNAINGTLHFSTDKVTGKTSGTLVTTQQTAGGTATMQYLFAE